MLPPPENTSPFKVLLCEFVGTTFFLFLGLSSVATTGGSLAFPSPGNLPANAFGNGIALFVTMFFFSGISGAHFNPAVTFGYAATEILRGKWRKYSFWKIVFYPMVQFAGAIAATLLVWVVVGTRALPPGLGIPVIAAGVGDFRAFFIEALFAGCLIFAYLWTDIIVEPIYIWMSVVADRKILDQPLIWLLRSLGQGLVTFLRALVIGFLYIVLVFAGVPVTGANLNPFRYLAPAIITNNYPNWAIFVLAPFGGTIFAVVLSVGLYWFARITATGTVPDPEETPTYPKRTFIFNKIEGNAQGGLRNMFGNYTSVKKSHLSK